MKTRIISGIVMGVIVAAVLAAGYIWNTVVITAAIGIISAIAVYELLHNAVKVESKFSLIGAMVFVFLNSFISIGSDRSLLLAIAYFVYAAIFTLKNHKSFSLAHILGVCFAPVALSTAFNFLNYIIINEKNIYYLLLLLNFSSVCDMGAYFVGVTLGKHKLCPEISPKKTVEGAVGGILSSMVFTVILFCIFTKNLWPPLLLTIPFCILGMIGDLFASAIKRSVDLKDYGNLIPGHGGILDRLDSILMIAPVMGITMALGII